MQSELTVTGLGEKASNAQTLNLHEPEVIVVRIRGNLSSSILFCHKTKATL